MAIACGIDVVQRSVLFWDAIRKRADIFLEHESKGLPPVLNFEYETVLDARSFERPCNYALLRILTHGDACMEKCLDASKAPVVIVDPRAGHGPGIGGFKRESEVGIAMHRGHPVYFVIFYPEPEPHQTVSDVLAALRRFVEHVRALHSGKPPILYGNCQAGWMLALLSADCQGLVGPAVLCGSPLSYWASKGDRNTMQLEGGLLGGVWLNRFLGDVGAGEFDGAWLVLNFETMNPANAVWSKYYNLYANIDTEEERFLSFERWWNGFYRFSTEEIVATASQLFVGNEIERGELPQQCGCRFNLKHIKNPLLVFASEGDEITPPYEALAWVAAIYKTTDELEAAGQRIAYLIHPKVGHLGIFVSADVARKQHNAILSNINQLNELKPGLYEMKVLESSPTENCDISRIAVTFEERAIEDIACRRRGKSFERVRQVSELNDMLYSLWVSPWVRMAANPFLASVMRWLHPMRTTRFMWSTWLNPWMWSVAESAPIIRRHRLVAAHENPLRAVAIETAGLLTTAVDEAQRTVNDQLQFVFRLLYGR
jgi:pimeloyl-ACP methyl ester carboxylesterase